MVLPSICPVNANFVDLFWIIPYVFDMPKDMTSAVLTDEVSQVGTYSKIRNCALVKPPFFNRKSFE